MKPLHYWAFLVLTANVAVAATVYVSEVMTTPQSFILELDESLPNSNKRSLIPVSFCFFFVPYLSNARLVS